jgi:hypothetical protein
VRTDGKTGRRFAMPIKLFGEPLKPFPFLGATDGPLFGQRHPVPIIGSTNTPTLARTTSGGKRADGSLAGERMSGSSA